MAAILLAGLGWAPAEARREPVRQASLDFLDLSDARPSRDFVRGFTPLLPDADEPGDLRRTLDPVPTPGRIKVLQCVPYARRVSGIQIHGDAHTWWGQAAGRYARGETPRKGAVLALKGSGAMPLGHVAMVSRIVSDREILIDHANWSSPGQIERGVPAIDVSPYNDWSQIRVWFGRTGQMGARVNPAHGFIYPEKPGLDGPPIRYASAETAPVPARRLLSARQAQAQPRLEYDLAVMWEFEEPMPRRQFAQR